MTIAELGIERYDRMAALYDVLELSTAVKPWLLRAPARTSAASSGSSTSTRTSGSSTRSTRSTSCCDEHRSWSPRTPPSRCRATARKPSETDILTVGRLQPRLHRACRAAPDTDQLLDWWSERLERDCVRRPRARAASWTSAGSTSRPGSSTSFHVLRDPGYNVAYWNLAEPRAGPTRGDALGGERPPAALLPLQRASSPSGPTGCRSTRTGSRSSRDRPLARALRRLRATSCWRAATRGHERVALLLRRAARRRWSWTQRAARVYREADRPGRARRSSVFTPTARPAADWSTLNGPGRGGRPVGRHALPARALRGATRTLQDAVPRPATASTPSHLVAWANADGRAGIPQQLLPSSAARTRRRRGAARRREPGRLLRLGARASARWRGRSWTRSRARTWRWPRSASWPATSPRGAHRIAERGAPPTPRSRSTCLRERRRAARASPTGWARTSSPGRHTIGLWWWEVERLPGALARGRSSTSTRSGSAPATWPTRSARRCRPCRWSR